MAAVLTVMGSDVSSYVTEWGEVEDVKEVLLVRSQLFTGEHSIVLSNVDGRFSPYKAGSLFYGKAYFQSIVTLTEDGETLFTGLLKQVMLNKADRTCTLKVENYFTILTTQVASLVATSVGPMAAALSILETAGMAELVDRNSFVAAAADAASAGAVVSVDFTDSNQTALAAIQDLADLASVAIYVRGGIIQARPFQAYQGSSAGLRYPIDSTVQVDVGALGDAYDNLKNVVTFEYSTSSTLVLRDEPSIRRYQGYENAVKLSYNTGQSIVISDLASASYFARKYLDRCSTLRRTLELVGSNELRNIRIGDRHPVTDSHYGLSSEPFEVIETHRQIQAKTISLTLATLR